MLILSSTTDKIEIVTSAAVDIDWVTSYTILDLSGTPVVDGADNHTGTVAAAATTDISGSPAAATDRWNINSINLRNRHASSANDVTVRHVNSGTSRELIKVTLQAGWALVRDKEGHWFVYDAAGGVVMGQVQASDTVAGLIEIASQAEMEAGSDTSRAVAPGRLHFHPGVAKCWGMADVSANVPTLRKSYNITSITDTATGQLTVTVATDFSDAFYAVVIGSRLTATTYAVANDRKVYVRFGTQAAGSFILDCIDSTATTNLAKDPDSWNWACFGDLA